MDLNRVFEDMVARHRYPTFSGFQGCLGAFQETSGFVYIKDNSNKFKEDPQRSTLVYRSLVYYCSFYGGKGNRKKSGTQCTSKFKVSGAGGILTVVDWDMTHNHSTQPINLNQDVVLEDTSDELAPIQLVIPNSEGINDLSDAFTTHFPQMWFKTFDEFDIQLKQFEVETGSHYNKWKGDKFPLTRPERTTLVYRRLTYACYHFGESRQNENSRNRTPKIGCTSVIYLRAENNLLRISRFDMRHCHAVGPEYVNKTCLKARRQEIRRNSSQVEEANIVNEEVAAAISQNSSPIASPKAFKPRQQRLPLTRDEKISIISPYLNQLVSFACEFDDARFYRSMETVRNLHNIWSSGSDAVVRRGSIGFNLADLEFLEETVDINEQEDHEDMYYEDTV